MIYEKNGVRITLLTPCLLRIETGSFTDLPTQTVWNRDLGEASCEITCQADICTVKTTEVTFRIGLKQRKVTAVTLADGTTVTDFTSGILPGTARTLDTVDGAAKLEPGIMSRSGVCMMDDSKSLLLQDGDILPRPVCTDLYCFAYGHAYERQLQDFFRLTGPVPLIPRYALGNWWSRYRAYTQEEYRSLMQKFIARKLPITVATIDMDWHWTNVMERFGPDAKPPKPRCKEELFYNNISPGWTGYTWNTELFPDHRELLDWLHANHFHVTLNVHPSQGIRFFEDCYDRACKHLGKDPESREPLPFNITDKSFRRVYFEDVHHPLEAEGVDFWWLDWQQGTQIYPGSPDPLWALNHYHTQDKAGGSQRPLILSRYAGLGSHRYPLGFSGDTICSWESLDFQPYFTNSAANAGYTWWSHDIGGHMKGVQDDELYLRWLQYGVFSPINRLHSSNSDFMGKEPWKRSWAVEKIADEFLRLRHRLIPYLYTANYHTHTQGTPICIPMYYRYDCADAYEAKNEYIFGGHLLVCPVTQRTDKRLNLAKTRIWLPEGRWTDIFSGRIYKGGQWVNMYRDLDSIPVLAAPGAIVPMYRSADTNDLSLSQPLDIHIWRGNGHYELYEDDGQTNAFQQGISTVTVFDTAEGGTSLRLTITPPACSHGLLPENREMYLRFRDIVSAQCRINGETVPYGSELRITVSSHPVTVELYDVCAAQNRPTHESRIDLLTRVQGNNRRKSIRFRKNKFPKFVLDALKELEALL